MKVSRFSTSRFGLNERETQLLLSAVNGIGLHEGQVVTTQWLSQQIYDAGVESHTDIRLMGSDLTLGESNPEAPLEYQDLVEKIQKLTDWQSAALYLYSCGFFEGQNWALSSRSFGKSSA
jgi:hypothetical protein